MPISLGRQLDAQAQLDSELWELCQQQDFDDNPRSRGVRIRPGSPLSDALLDEFGGPEARQVSRRPSLGHQSSGSRRARRHTTFVNDSWASDGVLTLTSDIEQGWRETKTTWCFRESTRVELPAEYSLRVTVEILEDRWGQWRRQCAPHALDTRQNPEGIESIDSLYPSFSPSEKQHGEVRIQLDGPTCIVTVSVLDKNRELNNQLPWQRVDAHWQFRWCDGGHYERPVRPQPEQVCTSRPFQFQLTAVLHDPPRPARDVEYEYDTPFASAGLPSLGKRR